MLNSRLGDDIYQSDAVDKAKACDHRSLSPEPPGQNEKLEQDDQAPLYIEDAGSAEEDTEASTLKISNSKSSTDERDSRMAAIQDATVLATQQTLSAEGSGFAFTKKASPPQRLHTIAPEECPVLANEQVISANSLAEAAMDTRKTTSKAPESEVDTKTLGDTFGAVPNTTTLAEPQTATDTRTVMLTIILSSNKTFRYFVRLRACTRAMILDEAKACCMKLAQNSWELAMLLVNQYDRLILAPLRINGYDVSLSTYDAEDLTPLIQAVWKTGIPEFTIQISQN